MLGKDMEPTVIDYCITFQLSGTKSLVPRWSNVKNNSISSFQTDFYLFFCYRLLHMVLHSYYIQNDMDSL